MFVEFKRALLVDAVNSVYALLVGDRVPIYVYTVDDDSAT